MTEAEEILATTMYYLQPQYVATAATTTHDNVLFRITACSPRRLLARVGLFRGGGEFSMTTAHEYDEEEKD